MPNSAVRDFSDPAEYELNVRASDVTVVLTSPGRYRASLTKIDLHRLWMQRGETAVPHISYTAVRKDRNAIYFLADPNHAPIYENGLELSPGKLVVGSSGATHHRRSATGIRWGSMSLTPDDLAAAGRALVGRDLVAPGETRLIQSSPYAMSRLLQLHEAAGHLAATVPHVLAHPEVAKAIEQELVRIVVHCLAEGSAVGPGRETRLPVMKRFEQTIGDNPDTPLYVAEICAAIGVSDRTLRLHCAEHLGIGPHKYLWLRRMRLAQRALARAYPTMATVTSIANDYGFGELGRFAVAYRRLFGEAPSRTLCRGTD